MGLATRGLQVSEERLLDDAGDGTRVFEPILRTKLYPSQLGTGLVNRDRLIEVVNRTHEVPLTLVSAPAGYGKSVLAALRRSGLRLRTTARSPPSGRPSTGCSATRRR